MQSANSYRPNCRKKLTPQDGKFVKLTADRLPHDTFGYGPLSWTSTQANQNWGWQVLVANFISKRKRMKKIETALAVGAVVVLIILVPAWLPFVLVIHALDQHRMRVIARTFRCAVCGVLLGDAALRLADAAWAKRMDELSRTSPPGTKFRVVRHLFAICPACGHRYNYMKKTRTFEQEA